MKKSLVLAMAMALGVTASAYAANPFSDVPAGHWAYDSISKLAAAGVIEGYGDDTFRGDRLMTRYEMAQIVAKAMAKGANVDKLAAEFADELDALGVRVAALEKKSDNVKITGEMRYGYQSNKIADKKSHGHHLRTRLTFTGTVNDNWKYVGLVENIQDLTNNIGDEGTSFQRAYIEGRLGGMKTIAGRYNKTRLDGGDLYGTRFDGVDFTYGKQVKLNAYFGKPTNSKAIWKADAEKWKDKAGGPTTNQAANAHYAWGINASADLGKNVNLFVGYDEFKVDQGDAINGTAADGVALETGKDKIFDVGLKFKLGKAADLTATYLHAKLDRQITAPDKEGSKNGFIIGANYGGAKANKVGSWGLGAKYYQMPAGGSMAAGWQIGDAYTLDMYKHGMKGWYAYAKYTVAKNMIADVEYWDLKDRETDKKGKVLWTALYVTF